MRILLMAHGYPPTVGGVESHLWDLSHRLARRGYEVCCLVGDGGPGATGLPLAVRRDANLSAGFLIARRRGRRPDELDRSLLDLVGSSIGKAIADAQPDVVHAHNLHRFAPEPAHALLAEASVPVVHTVHDVVSDTTNPGVLALPWTHTVCVSAHLRDSLRSTLAAPSSVIPVGVDCARFAGRVEPHPFLRGLERPIILHPARLLRWKGPLVGVAAFLRLREALGRGSLVLCHSPDVLAGASETVGLVEEIDRIAGRAGARGSVHYRQFARDEMPPAYRGADLVWYPTTGDEALGLAPIEAMAAGCPVVVSDSGGLKEGVVPGESGIRVRRNDIEALARAARSVLTDRDLRRRLVRGGVMRAGRFDNRVVTDRLARLYASC